METKQKSRHRVVTFLERKELDFLDGIGKDILFKTLLDAAGVLTRYRGVIVKRELYEGLLRLVRYNALPRLLISSWIEVFYEEKWVIIDGVAFDTAYLEGVRKLAADYNGREFTGYGLAVFDGGKIVSEWTGEHLFFQRAAVTKDLGVIEDLDWYFGEYKRAFKSLSSLHGKSSQKIIDEIRQ